MLNFHVKLEENLILYKIVIEFSTGLVAHGQ
jgi:hypothetical protein